MAYLGRNPAIGTQKMLDSLESQFNGVLTTFNLRFNAQPTYPTLSASLIVSLGGVLQEPGQAYYVSSDTIVFSEAPAAGTDCWILLYSEYGAGIIPDQQGNFGAATLTLTGELRGPSTFIIDPAVVGDDTGDVVIKGNLTVQGATTTINSTTLTVDDKNIVLADSASPTDALADGGGITLKGTTDKTINWVDATDAWTSSERFSYPLGSATAPALTFTGDPNTGIYSPGADQVAISTNGTGRLFVDASGRIGIGTTNPNGTLEVANGDAYITKNSGGDAGGVTSQSLYIRTQSGNLARLYSISSGSGGPNGFGGTLYIQTKVDNGSLADHVVITQAGLVGIGTTSPSEKVTIGAGLETGRQYLRLNFSNTDTYIGQSNGTIFGLTSGNGSFIVSDAGVPLGVGTVTSQSLILGTNGLERARIDSSGRVGIGITNPSELLHVNGNLALDNAVLNTPKYIKFNANAIGNPYGGITWYNYQWDSTKRAEISSGPDGAVAAGYLAFSTGSGGITERLRITSAGNVGIGTDNPTAKLEVSNSSGTTGILISNNVAISLKDSTGAARRTALLSDSNNFYYGDVDNATSGGNLFLLSKGNINFFNNGTNNVTFSSTGFVGIGTANPTAKLDVRGPAYFVGSNTNRSTTIDTSVYIKGELGGWVEGYYFRGSSNTNLGGFGIYGNNDTTAYFWIGPSYSSPSLVIASNGNVGIGTASIAEKLHIHNPDTGLAAIRLSGSAGSQTPYNIRQGVVGVSNGGFSIWDVTAAATRFAIDSAGNIGIGTDAPIDKLHVSGGQTRISSRAKTLTGDILVLSTTESANRMELLISHAATNYHRIQSVHQGVAYTALCLQNDGGNVGIGVTNPSEKLEVNGNLRVTLDAGSQKNVARIVELGYSGITGAKNWALRGVYQHPSGVSVNADGGDLDLIKSLNGNTILATKTDGTALGNVGIGTTNPTSALHVIGSGTFTGSVSAAGTSGFYSSTFANNVRNPIWRFANADGYGLSYFQGSAGVSPAGGGDTIGFHFGTATAAASLLQLNNGHGAVVNGNFAATGNVGIGTTNPSEKLYVVGTIVGASNDNYFGNFSSGAYVDIGNLATTEAWIDTRSSSLATVDLNMRTKGNGQIKFITGVEERLRITGAGNVGIGTTNPEMALHVFTPSDTVPVRIASNGGDSSIGFKAAADALTYNTRCGSYQGAGFGIWTANTLRFVLNNSGYVGIGTNNPTAKLVVDGGGPSSIAFRDDSIENHKSDSDSAALVLNYYGLNGGTSRFRDVAIYNGKGGFISIFDGSSGNVGIGTTNPLSKLHITGQLQTANPSTYSAITGIDYGNSYPIYCTEVNAGSGGFTPFILQRTVVNSGYRQILSIGSYRANGGSYTGGAYIAPGGGSDSSPTDYFLFSYQGSLSYSGGTISFPGQIQSTQGNNAATGGGQIYLNGSTGNRIDFNTSGVAPPALVGTGGATRSAGTKIVLYPGGSPSYADAGFGIEDNTLWSSIWGTAHQFKWYAGTTNIATLTGGGNLTVTGEIQATLFRDYNDNNYYVNPAGTSRLNTLRIFSNSSADWDAIQISTDGVSGLIQGLGDEVGLKLRSELGNIILADDRGNVGIGTTNPAYKLEVNGSFAATTKSFVIPHPTKEGYRLRYGSLEGPENGVYVRGRSKVSVIELPEYWTKLVDPDSITVNLTPIGKTQTLWVESIEENTVYVGSECSEVEYFYTIFAERADVDRLEVELEG
jgi:hypothetical protein